MIYILSKQIWTYNSQIGEKKFCSSFLGKQIYPFPILVLTYNQHSKGLLRLGDYWAAQYFDLFQPISKHFYLCKLLSIQPLDGLVAVLVYFLFVVVGALVSDLFSSPFLAEILFFNLLSSSLNFSASFTILSISSLKTCLRDRKN